jgi:isopenicillin-N N-acyltransferase-like protein
VKAIELAGGHYDMGLQHARQVRELRPRIMKAVRQRVKRLKPHEADLQPYVTELATVWEEAARPSLDMLRGIAEGLDLKWEPFFRYTIASYLEDRLQYPNNGDGCTVWAAAEPITRHGAPLLAKNRDYRPNHLPLQCLARAYPIHGYRYISVTSAGSPAVFSSGMNEKGLAVADTHVTSPDIGPGVARYSAMMEILEHHDDVASALDYLRQVLHIGDGTLVLIDLAGRMAVFEAGHSAHGIVWPEHNLVVSTNHFCSAQMRDRWIDRSPTQLQGNSQNRSVRVAAALQAARGQVDTEWAQRLMSDHGGARPTVAEARQYAICRHSNIDPLSTTISTALYLPLEYTLLFGNGSPCQVAPQAWSVL